MCNSLFWSSPWIDFVLQIYCFGIALACTFFLIEHHLTQLTKRSSKEKEKYEVGQGCGKESAFSILSVQLFFFFSFYPQCCGDDDGE